MSKDSIRDVVGLRADAAPEEIGVELNK